MWISAASGAASLVAVRLSIPAAIDEPLTALAVFAVIPTLLIVAFGAIRGAVGLGVAVVLPFAWLAIAFGAGDSPAIWLVPCAAAVVIFATKRPAARRGTALRFRWLGLAAVCGALLIPPPGAPASGTRAVLIGIDGATWQVVDAQVAAGRMPCLKRLLADGHRANLRSLPSMLSPQVWSAIATGCPPSVNGIHGWACSQADFRTGRIWDQMRMEGRSIGTCGWYFTWPPPDNLGSRDFVIPSTLAPDGSTFPPECSFFWELWARESGRRSERTSYASIGIRAVRHGVRLSTLRRASFELARQLVGGTDPLDRGWRSRRLSAAIQTDMFAELSRQRRPEFAAVLLNQVDKVSHVYWKYQEPEGFPEVTPADMERYGPAVGELYAEVDRCIDKIVRSIPPDAEIVIVSDHGFRPALRKAMGRFCRIRTENLIDALGCDLFGTNLDRKVYLEPGSLEDDGLDDVLVDIVDVLRTAHLRGESAALFDVVREDRVIRLEIAARDAVPEDAVILMNGEEYALERLVSSREEALFSGEHAEDGVYLLSGPSAVNADPVDSLSVLDVAPTLAAVLGLPLPLGSTGRPALTASTLTEIEWAAYPPPTDISRSRVPVDEALKDKLRTLGYLE